jgi:hypothetical protein
MPKSLPNGHFSAKLISMTAASDGLAWVPELRLVQLADVARSTYQSWERDGLVEQSETGAYTERHVIEAILVDALRSTLPRAATANVLARLRAVGDLERLVDRARGLDPGDHFDAVVEVEVGSVVVCHDDASLAEAVRDPHRPRTVTVIPLADALIRARSGFWTHAHRGAAPAERKRGRPKRAGASVRPLRGER